MSIHDLPAWTQVVQLVGEEQAAVLSALYGGGNMYVPKMVGRHHPLSETLGYEDAVKLTAVVGGLNIPVPIAMGKRARILQLRAAGGLSTADVARKVGCSRRTVFYVYAEADQAADDAGDWAQLALPL